VNIELGDLATWVTGIATAGAWTAALISIRRERKTREEFNKDKLERESRNQAVKISSWFGGRILPGDERDSLILLNRSDTPIYNVVATMVFAQGGAPRMGEDMRDLPDHRACYTVLPPGTWRAAAPGGWGGMHRMPAVEIAFTDTAGLNWVRRGSGQLMRLPAEPFDHFEVTRPIDFELLAAVAFHSPQPPIS